MSTDRKKTVILFLFWLLTVLVLNSQDVRVSISSREGYVGLPLEYKITITDTEKADVPDLAGFDGFDVQYKGQSQSSQTSIINGKRSSSVTVMFSWNLIPLREGELLIPSIDVELGGRTYQTPEGRVVVSPPREVEGFKLILEPVGENMIEGHPVTVNMDFYVSSEVGNLQFTLPGKGTGSREGTDFAILDSSPPDQSSHDVRQIPIGDRVFYGYVSSRMEGGSQFTVLTVPLEIVPLRSGSITLEGATVAFTSQRGAWPRSVTEDHVIPSRECSLTVSPLPAAIENSPNGILLSRGELKGKVSLSAREARPGDPLKLQIVLAPLDHPELCEIPSLGDFTSLEQSFSLPADRSRPKAEGDSLTITQIIRPVSVSAGEVPPMDFVYYDLDAEAVRHLRTDPIPLAMSSAGDLSLSDVVSFQAGEGPPDLRENDRGIRQNKSLKELSRGDRRGTTLQESLPWRLTVFVPPGLFVLVLLLLAGLHIWDRGRERAHNNALKQLKRALGAGEDPFLHFDRYLSQRLFRGKSFRRDELQVRASELEMGELMEIYAQLELGRFGGGESSMSPEEIIRAAEKLEKRL